MLVLVERIAGYKRLEVWKVSMDLVDHIYQLTDHYPETEKYSLSVQMRRSATSIPSNIAEGQGRWHRKECLQYLHIARGSLYELETQLLIAWRRKFHNGEQQALLQQLIDQTGKMLNGLIRSMSGKT